MFGYDLSSQLFNVLISGEVSLRNGKDMPTIDLKSPVLAPTNMGNTWIPRAAVNLTKFFPVSGVADRLMVSGEFYYNQAGYDTNMFNDPRMSLLQSYLTQSGSGSPASQIYEPNSYSKYYAALFTSVGQFLIDQMTLSCNLIGNLNQESFMASTGVSYQSLHDFNFGVTLNGFFGKKNTEYTFTGSGLQVQATMGMVF